VEDPVSILDNPEFGFGPEDAAEAESPAETAGGPSLAEVYASIAALVRQNAADHGRLTDIASVEALIPPAAPDSPPLSLEEMVRDEQYSDIQPAFASNGEVYLFSTQSMDPAQAALRAEIEALWAGIAQRVRADSAQRAQLTPLRDLELPEPAPESSAPALDLSAMQADERYTDIRSLTISNGAIYLFSETYMAPGYATLLGRAAAKDPLATIAETVRDNARIYPRPTSIKSFEETLFDINPAELEAHVARLLEMPEYEDIKKATASNGAVYLYSITHMAEGQAQYLAEWDAVGRDANP
jgi:hypothetical protein